ncbi:hypothetical protein MO867_18180 [Microbulbifer sp. OS29]|uniref:Uncharacterized protein n=1 Tax=Microbulbifer okhotskensis TaxID=2926617 RepID=A0A9X2EUR7_9GAMM|nr:hypothetical protein [Microbulbifer okhotskensis]MCO1336263.1 hypothetical protein [Microbulbifer okhotskensis]
MKFSIINGDAGDDTVVVDGAAFHFDLAGLIDDSIWAVQWSDDSGKPEGEIEHRDGTHKKFKSIKPFQKIIDRWHEEKAQAEEGEVQQQAFFKSKEYALDVINNLAGKARKRFVPIGYGMTDEYARVKDAAQQFAEAGFTGEVPAAVQTHAEVKGVSPQQAAETILQAASNWNNALDKIREIRIKAKSEVEAAGEDADYLAIAQPFLATLKALEN